MMSAAFLKSQAGLPLLCSEAIQRRMKSASIISRVSSAMVRPWILVVATVSFSSLASRSLQSPRRVGGL